ncbi:MAG: hypothetical protein WCX76_01100, partial [Candidatus Methanomethylophilaceae archaeon]
GLGGSVMAPNKVFCLNLEKINFTRLFYSTYCTNRVKVDGIESYQQLLEMSELKEEKGEKNRDLDFDNCLNPSSTLDYDFRRV